MKKLILILLLLTTPLVAITKRTTIPDLMMTADLFHLTLLSCHEERNGNVVLFFDGDIFTLERDQRYITFVEFRQGKPVRGGWYLRKQYQTGEERSLRVTNF